MKGPTTLSGAALAIHIDTAQVKADEHNAKRQRRAAGQP
jgi:hypothetical protein